MKTFNCWLFRHNSLFIQDSKIFSKFLIRLIKSWTCDLCMIEIEIGNTLNFFFWNITLLEVYRVLGLEYPEKTTDLPQVTDKLYHIWAWFELTLVVIGTDCTSSYISNYHTITTIMTLLEIYILWMTQKKVQKSII